MKHKENHYVRISNQDNRPIQSIMSMSQVKTREPSMCNQDMSIHLSSNRIPRLLHSKFKLDPLMIPSGVAILWTPHFGSMRFPLDGETRFLFEKLIFYRLFENDLESPFIFILFLKGKQNKKEKP